MICRTCGTEFTVYRCTACPGAEVNIRTCRECHRAERHPDLQKTESKKKEKPLTKRRKRV